MTVIPQSTAEYGKHLFVLIMLEKMYPSSETFISENLNLQHCMHGNNVANQVWGGLPAQTAWCATEKAMPKHASEKATTNCRSEQVFLPTPEWRNNS